jgi:hypothetical protein
MVVFIFSSSPAYVLIAIPIENGRMHGSHEFLSQSRDSILFQTAQWVRYSLLRIDLLRWQGSPLHVPLVRRSIVEVARGHLVLGPGLRSLEVFVFAAHLEVLIRRPAMLMSNLHRSVQALA